MQCIFYVDAVVEHKSGYKMKTNTKLMMTTRQTQDAHSLFQTLTVSNENFKCFLKKEQNS